MDKDMPRAEEWRTVPGHPDYEVSSLGRIRSYKSGQPRLRKLFTDKLGYVRLQMDGVRWSVHRAVAAAWHGPCPDGKEVDHINRVRGDNRPENLRYLTRQENMARMVSPAPPTHCPAKHPLSGGNLYVRPNGSRSCRRCATQQVRDLRNGSSGQPCTADGCGRHAYVWLRTEGRRPVCEMHYQRIRKAEKRQESPGESAA